VAIWWTAAYPHPTSISVKNARFKPLTSDDHHLLSSSANTPTNGRLSWRRADVEVHRQRSGRRPDIDGVDRHFYENQVPPSSPFRDNAFALATARAKDNARHELIVAIQEADADARNASFAGFGNQGLSGEMLSIDGCGGPPLTQDVKPWIGTCLSLKPGARKR
jgi:hypothetical protein